MAGIDWKWAASNDSIGQQKEGFDYAQQIAAQAAKMKSGSQYAAGDYAGAAQTQAASGDIPGAAVINKTATDMQETEQKRYTAGHAYIAQALPILQKVAEAHANEGPEGQGQALGQVFDHISEEARAATGVSEQQMQQFRAQLMADPTGTLERLQAALPEEYKAVGAGSTLVRQQGSQVTPIYSSPKDAPNGYQNGADGSLTFIPGGPADPEVIKRTATDRREIIVNNPIQQPTGGPINTADPVVTSWVGNVLNGNATMQQVPARLRNSVSMALSQTDHTSYSPTAVSRFSAAANRILQNYIKLPQYQLTAGGLPYLQRIDAAIQTPGSVSDQDLLDSLTKLNTAGNAISDAQVRLITDGKSWSDIASTFANKFKNGGVLSDNQRGQIQKIAKAIYTNYRKGYQPVYDQATKQLKESGIPEAFWSLPDLNKLADESGLAAADGSPPPAAAQPSAQPGGQPTPQDIVNELRKRGLVQ